MLIRKFQKEDIAQVAGVWLSTNISAHDFVPAQYWQSHFDTVKEQLLEAEIYVCEDGGDILGFVGMSSDYIAGLFVKSGAKAGGIGKKPLDYAKSGRSRLTLRVYQKNAGAVRFYQREGFTVQEEPVDESTGEPEYFMLWER